MKALKKALLAGAAVGALSAIVATSAFAASYADGKVSVETDLSEYNGQMTVLVIAKGADEKEGGIVADDILYIDQTEAAAGIFQDMGVKGGKLDEGEYIVKIGGENVNNIITETLKIEGDKPAYKFADVNADDNVDAEDVTRLLRHTTGIEPLTYEEEELNARCDVNEDETVDAEDVTRLLRHTTGIEPLEGVE